MFANADLEEIYKRSLNSPDYRTTVIIEQLDKFGKVAEVGL